MPRYPIRLPFLVLLSFFFSVVQLNAKNGIGKITVTGYVYDNQSQPIAGATVMEKGRATGVATDSAGAFSIDAEQNSVLVFSAVGFETKELVVTSSSPLTIVLQRLSGTLEEIVAIGYTRVKRAEFSGAVSSVQAKDLNTTTPTLGQSLVGKVAGVQIAQVSGAPYVSTKIRVRGVGSINASSDPLYVVDGYPAGTDVYINPEDIETIDILKDAASPMFTK